MPFWPTTQTVMSASPSSLRIVASIDLRGAVGDIEAVGLDVLRGLDLVVARVVVEVLRTREVRQRVGHVEREREVLLEHGVDLGLVVRRGERVAARGLTHRRAGVHLRRPADDAVVVVRVVDRVAVGLVEVRGVLRAVREHGLVAVGAGDGVEQRRVGRVVVGRVGDRGQQQLARGVPVDVGLERDATLEAVDGQVLGLRQRVRAAVGLRTEGVRGAFLVDAALGRVVAVRVDAVLVVAVDAVGVVVADGLAPEAVVVGGADAVVARDLRGAEAAGEGEVVAVRVLDRQEPEFTRLDELA